MLGVTAAGATPLLALTVNVDAPAVVGVPVNAPVAEFSVNPGGKIPLATA